MNQWEFKRLEINRLLSELQRKPESEKMGYILCPGGILNAYREGDIDFKTAVSEIETWAKSQ